MNAVVEPKLAAPGAGLPKVELLAGRAMFAWRRWRGNRETFNAFFQQERERVRALVQSCNAEAAGRRVLIERVRGMEDSSRYWSVWMTLDHLRIVNGQITKIIKLLAEGKVPPGKGSTANVKPSVEVTATVREEYERSCDDLLAVVADVPDLNTRVRYAHPWFGPLNAAGWHALAPGHLSIHRAQLERIVEGL